MSPSDPVGVFDSGMGGFAVASILARQLPNERILYLGDIAHRPYGPRPAIQVARYLRWAEEFFVEAGCKAMVIACNTASVAVDATTGLLPTVDMVAPSIAAALALRPGKIGILGTRGTIDSGVYQRRLEAAGSSAPVVAHACEEALRLAERGGGDDQGLLERLLAGCLEPVSGCDVVILACTDFTCVRGTLDRVNKGRAVLIDPAGAVVDQLELMLGGLGPLAAEAGEPPHHRYCVTAPDPDFAAFGRTVFDLAIDEVEVVQPLVGVS
jgi:glutamate racemase